MISVSDCTCQVWCTDCAMNTWWIVVLWRAGKIMQGEIFILSLLVWCGIVATVKSWDFGPKYLTLSLCSFGHKSTKLAASGHVLYHVLHVFSLEQTGLDRRPKISSWLFINFDELKSLTAHSQSVAVWRDVGKKEESFRWFLLKEKLLNNQEQEASIFLQFGLSLD